MNNTYDEDIRNRDEHETYGMLLVHRMESPGEAPLFGSSIPCKTQIALTLRRGVEERHLNHNWFLGQEELFEIRMSPAQFAEAITNMNVGSGVPCTIRYIKGQGDLGPCPYRPKFDEYGHEFSGKIANIDSNIVKALDDISAALDAKTIKKSDLREVQTLLKRVRQDLTSNLSFVQKSFDEYVAETTSDAKQEIEAFMQHRLTELGLESARQLAVDANRKELTDDGGDSKEA